jgi:hypothetical protein
MRRTLALLVVGLTRAAAGHAQAASVGGGDEWGKGDYVVAFALPPSS